MDSNGLEIKNYLIFPIAISRISSDDPHFQFRNCSINQSIFPRFETTNSKRVRIEVYELNVSLYFHPRLGQLLFSPASITVHRFSHLSKTCAHKRISRRYRVGSPVSRWASGYTCACHVFRYHVREERCTYNDETTERSVMRSMHASYAGK